MATVVYSKKIWHSTTRRYEWDKWTDGRTWRARKGADYDIDDRAFQRKLHNHATYKQLKVRTKVEKTGVVIFQFFSKGK